MKHILYIGNKMLIHGQTATTIETLGVLLEEEGYEVYYASSVKNKFFRMCDMILKTLWHAPKLNYVLIDTYGAVNFWYALIIAQICRVLRIKYIPFLHGGDLPKRLDRSPRLCKLLFDHSYINIAPSAYLMDIFIDHGFKKLSYIPNTIELSNYPYLKRVAPRPRLLWVRSISQVYNPIMALEVFSKLKELYPLAALCMVGPDKNGYLSEVRAYADKKNLDVVFTGRLTKPEWITLSKEYDIFINTTTYDNMPVSVIEGMALGLPIVSTNVGGIPYLLSDEQSALLVNSGDVENMVAAVVKLIEEPLLADNLSRNARDIVAQFDWNVVKYKWNDILK